MIQKDRTLISEEGMVLTNGSDFFYEVRLGDWDAPENYREITEAEAEEIQMANITEDEIL